MGRKPEPKPWKCGGCGAKLIDVRYCVACSLPDKKAMELDAMALAERRQWSFSQIGDFANLGKSERPPPNTRPTLTRQKGLQASLQRRATETTHQQSNAATGDVRGLGVDVSPPGVGEACAGT